MLRSSSHLLPSMTFYWKFMLQALEGRSMEGLITKSSSTLCLEGEEITETKSKFHNHRYVLKASMPCGSGKSVELVRVSNTNHEYGESSNARIREERHKRDKLVITQLIKPIEQRLSILEEEDEILKEAIFRNMEERKILMNEIFKQFQAIRNQLRLSNQEREYNFSFDELLASIQALKKARRPGLLQVLWQDSNPSLISRHTKEQAAAVQGRAK